MDLINALLQNRRENNTLRGCAVTGHQDDNASKYAKKADRNM